ncbi:phosphoribosylformylglycinamidine synthase subunit PurS [Shimazuella kribbensis]|uniref:phosphoribosylformylglycinamidine synthase subunit PurS n=1 Tax=Shimazuella kribbensis TaxID=139808 RepID=UPI000411FC89|nr:phosphoribosylformylglycinamidine synthase subunit PurS [Shimazuella kribbensis]
MYKATIFVTLKESVLDPQGVAVKGSLHTMGYSEVSDVRIGKRLEVSLDASSQAAAEEAVTLMCQKLFSNPVIEDFRFELEEV